MSTASASASRGKKAEKPTSFWSMDLGSLGKRGKKGKQGGDDDVVEHPPFEPTLPHVNLLPASVRNAIAVGRVRRYLVLALVVLLAAGALLWYVQGSRIAAAEADLARAQAESVALKDKVASLAAVQAFNTELQSQQDFVKQTLASQPQATEVVRRLTQAGERTDGPPITFSSIAVTYGGIPAPGEQFNVCPNPNPFGTDITIGCVTFTADAANRQQVSALLEQLGADPAFVGPYVGSTSLGQAGDTGNTRVTFTGTTGVSLDALETPLTQEQIDAIINPPQPDTPADATAATDEGAQ